MSSNPVALDPELLKQNLDYLGQKLSIELNSLKDKRISKPLNNYSNPLARAADRPTVQQNVISLPIDPTPITTTQLAQPRLSQTRESSTQPVQARKSVEVPKVNASLTPGNTPISPPQLESTKVGSSSAKDLSNIYTGLPAPATQTPTTTADHKPEAAGHHNTSHSYATAYQIMAAAQSISSQVQSKPYRPQTEASFTPPPTGEAIRISSATNQAKPQFQTSEKVNYSTKPIVTQQPPQILGFSQAVRQIVNISSPVPQTTLGQSTLSFGPPQSSASATQMTNPQVTVVNK